uniref:Aurora kinase A and ninein interacting protein n=1 Tax=Oryzias latipes TaxID=8090 RepID=A0A3P9LUX9_ORYLA
MKKSKTTMHPTHSQEECGVWLDPVQLKGKVKQKGLVRPISKLLNPLAKGEGYSLAVALNFTQTKMEMPKTKQSIISTFFTPHQRGKEEFLLNGSSLQKANLDESGVAHEQESKRFTETGQLSPFLDETEDEMAEDFNTVSHFKSNCKQSETENILHQKQKTDESTDSWWTKTTSLPLEKYLGSTEPDENTMANLFTQDSEGFRVISHRGRQTRSPLRDHSNLVTGMVRTCKSFQEEDDDEEMLFTQDSQGNLVIKH